MDGEAPCSLQQLFLSYPALLKLEPGLNLLDHHGAARVLVPIPHGGQGHLQIAHLFLSATLFRQGSPELLSPGGWHALGLVAPGKDGGNPSSEEADLGRHTRDSQLFQLLLSFARFVPSGSLHLDPSDPTQGTVQA